MNFDFNNFNNVFAELSAFKGKTFEAVLPVIEGHSYTVQYNRGRPLLVNIKLSLGSITLVFHGGAVDRIEFEFWHEKEVTVRG